MVRICRIDDLICALKESSTFYARYGELFIISITNERNSPLAPQRVSENTMNYFAGKSAVQESERLEDFARFFGYRSFVPSGVAWSGLRRPWKRWR
jgi:hypothetical protein